MSLKLRRLFSIPCALGLALVMSQATAQESVQERGAQQRERAQPQERRSQQQQQQRQSEREQVQRQRGEQLEEGRASQARGQEASPDSQLAACLIIGNQKEIALAEWGQEQAQSEEVKQFSQRMIQDHQKFIQQLEQYAQEGGYQSQQLAVTTTGGAEQRGAAGQRATARTQPQQAERRETERPGATETPRRAARSPELDRASGQQIDWVSLNHEMAQQCAESAQKELGEKSGEEFDKAFMVMQVIGHMNMADTLEVFSRHAGPELQAVLQQGLQTTQQHLEDAKQLCQQLEGQTQAGGQQERGQQQRGQQERGQQQREQQQ